MRMDMRLSKKRRLGIWYPASMTMGGNMYRKNIFGVRGCWKEGVSLSVEEAGLSIPP